MIFVRTFRKLSARLIPGVGPVCTRHYGMTLLAVLLVFSAFLAVPAVRGELATTEEMANVSGNWLTEMVYKQGNWAGDTSPKITGVKEIRHEGVLLARCYNISPRGYVVVPVLKEMVPVKAYSDESNLDELQEGGFLLLLKEELSERMELYADQYGSLSASQPDVGGVMFDRSQKAGWSRLAVRAKDYRPSSALSAMAQAGPLLTSAWHQSAPYNNLCPMGDGGRCVVGCVATAAAQILKFWQVPGSGVGSHFYTWDGDDSCGDPEPRPEVLSADFFDSYDWANIPDNCDGGCSSAQQAALAELNYEVGVAFHMDYGACGSGASVSPAVALFPTFFKFAPVATVVNRIDYTQQGWFDLIQVEIDNGRPIQYVINSHSIVCDGYRDQGGGQLEYHMNYGWGGSHTGWYVLDNLYCSWIEGDVCPWDEDYMVTHLMPQTDPVLGFKGHAIDDSEGDGDGRPDAGEEIELLATITNNGVDATNAAGVLTAISPNVTVTTSSANFDATISWGEQSTSLTPFVFSVSPSCPDPYVAAFELEVNADGGHFCRDTLLVFVGDTRGFSDNMETVDENWRHHSIRISYLDEWHRDTYRSHSGATSWKAGGSGTINYADRSDGALITPPFLLPPDAFLSFWHWISAEDDAGMTAWDGGIVMISSGDGEWTQVAPEGGYPYTIIDNLASPFAAGTPCFSGNHGWQEAQFDLSAYSGVVQIMFRFGSDGFVTEEGWYVDDILVANTNVGTAVVVEPVPGIIVTFNEVTVSGITEVSSGDTGPASPDGYTIVPLDSAVYYEISTTATFSGPISVCFTYDPNLLEQDEEALRLFHYEELSESWQNITSSLDTAANQICGTGISLSPFVLAEALCCTGPTMGNIDCEGIIDIGDLTEMIRLLFIDVGDPFCCDEEADLDLSGLIDIGDATMLTQSLFITLEDLDPCP